MNYDVLFELAAQSVNFNTHYFPGPHYPKSIPIAKIHGSINWLNPCKGGIAFGGLGNDAFFEIITPIFSNKIHMGSMMVLPLASIRPWDLGRCSKYSNYTPLPYFLIGIVNFPNWNFDNFDQRPLDLSPKKDLFPIERECNDPVQPIVMPQLPTGVQIGHL